MTIWIGIDTETTGLDEKREGAQILEIAAVAIDSSSLHQIDSKALAIRVRPETSCEPWALDSHTRSGLLDYCNGPFALDHGEAEDAIVKFIACFTPGPKDKCVLFGNTIGFDRRWLDAHMPRVTAALHYRSVDVSSFKEAARAWFPEAVTAWEKAYPKEKAAHRAAPDLAMSLEELRYYRTVAFKRAAGRDSIRWGLGLARETLGR